MFLDQKACRLFGPKTREKLFSACKDEFCKSLKACLGLMGLLDPLTLDLQA